MHTIDRLTIAKTGKNPAYLMAYVAVYQR